MRTQRIAYYDLREEADAGRLPPLVGRQGEMERLDALLRRRTNNNVALVGPSGIGKTALVHGWMRSIGRQSADERYALIQLDAAQACDLMEDPALEERCVAALSRLPSCVLFLDDFGRELYKNPSLVRRARRLCAPLLARGDTHLVLTFSPHEHAWLEREYPGFTRHFETILLKQQTSFECERILRSKMPALNARYEVVVPDASLQEIVSLAERFSSLGQLPKSAVDILDESLSRCAAQKRSYLSSEPVARVVETKTGVPRAQLAPRALFRTRRLERLLGERVVGQGNAVARIARTLERAQLGLRNPERPLGSFLMLGPSGVGKTETAKCVAEIVFGSSENFVRLDMSEFQQEHTVQRLLGAPPGYAGYEEGGALTNALSKEPHSLILLDEIEKAHPKVFDVFLQLLDDGRLTSGKNETVDARHAVVMATSNAAVEEILAANGKNGRDSETFLKETVLPALTKIFRLEFLNRFDEILVFEPLGTESLLRVARLEMEKLQKRLAAHRVRFELEPGAMEEAIRRIADPRFGARPVKRFVEETCESLLAEALLARATPSRL